MDSRHAQKSAPSLPAPQRPLEGVAVGVDEPVRGGKRPPRARGYARAAASPRRWVLRRLLSLRPSARRRHRRDLLLPVVRHTGARTAPGSTGTRTTSARPGRSTRAFYPARGPYSSSSRAVVDAQMADIAAAGVDEVVISWWGRGSVEDRRLPLVLSLARTAQARAGDPPGAVRRPLHRDGRRRPRLPRGARDPRRLRLPPGGLHGRRLGARARSRRRRRCALFAGTDARRVRRRGRLRRLLHLRLPRLRRREVRPPLHRGARGAHSSAPPRSGRATTASAPASRRARCRSRRNGRTYDTLWTAALAAHPDIVTITSYNEWGEGTQIEPARAAAGLPGLRRRLGAPRRVGGDART